MYIPWNSQIFLWKIGTFVLLFIFRLWYTNFEEGGIRMSEIQLVLQFLSEMDKRFTEKFEQLEGRFDLLEGRFDQLEGRFDLLEGRFDKLEGRFDLLEAKVDKLDAKVTMVHDQVVRNSEAIEQCVTKNDLKNIVNLLN